MNLNPESFWPAVGQLCLAFAIACAFYTLVCSILGERQKRPQFVRSAEYSLYACSGLISLALFILLFCFLTDNFLLRYVYGYSNRSMPWIYKITALWGGQDGSLLFWLWLSSLYASLASFFHRKSERTLLPYALTSFAVVLSFFGCLLLYMENPFRLFAEAPIDGRGLNPLLQNPSMAIHPPSLYLGYTGMLVPFAFAMSALFSNQLDARWIRATRLWTLIAWFFLSIGNLLGAQWAYVELGWGGFWAWDPVENAAILPWFTASAFLHSVMIQEKRDLLKFWNMTLVALSFCLTILGTFLTRSGVVQSVHSFARSEVGYYFLGFLGFIIVVTSLGIYFRRRELRSASIFESLLSKESAFVLNNIVLVGAAFIVLWCTLFPSASEMIIGTRIIVGPPFFNKMLAPLGIALLLLTGIGPVIGWKKASRDNLKSSFTWPIAIGIIASGLAALLGIYLWYVLATVFASAFVLTTLVMEFHKGLHARKLHYQESFAVRFLNLIAKNNRKYGGYIVHLGIVLIFMGIAGTAYKEIHEFDLAPTQSESFKEYTIQLKNFESYDSANQEETYAILDLYVGAEKVATLRPARFFYKAQEQGSTEVDIFRRFKEDVYFTLGSIHPDTGKARIQMTLNPLISFLWTGGLILILGGIISMLPFPARGRRA